jgi:hypothetical protein
MRFYIKMLLICVCFFWHPSIGRCEFITQGEWAKRLVKAIGLEEPGIPKDATIEDYISLLKGGESVYIPVEPVLKSNMIFDVNINKSGVYTLLIQSGASDLILRVDENVRFVQNGNDKFNNIYAGKYVLKRGTHKLTIIPQDGGSAGAVYLMAPCMPKIEPSGGWQPDKPLSFGDKAVTIIKALNMEDRLPAEKSFKLDYNNSGKIEFYIAEQGVYSFYLPTSNHLESEWFIDNCSHTSVVNNSNSSKLVWKEVGTYSLASGQHTLTIKVTNGKINGIITIVKRETSINNYMNLLKKLNPIEGEVNKNVTMESAIANLLNPLFAIRRSKGPEAFFYIEESEIPRMPSEEEKFPYTEPISPVLPSGI